MDLLNQQKAKTITVNILELYKNLYTVFFDQ